MLSDESLDSLSNGRDYVNVAKVASVENPLQVRMRLTSNERIERTTIPRTNDFERGRRRKKKSAERWLRRQGNRS